MSSKYVAAIKCESMESLRIIEKILFEKGFDWARSNKTNKCYPLEWEPCGLEFIVIDDENRMWIKADRNNPQNFEDQSIEVYRTVDDILKLKPSPIEEKLYLDGNLIVVKSDGIYIDYKFLSKDLVLKIIERWNKIQQK
jgi:hypothetical protein